MGGLGQPADMHLLLFSLTLGLALGSFWVFHSMTLSQSLPFSPAQDSSLASTAALSFPLRSLPPGGGVGGPSKVWVS